MKILKNSMFTFILGAIIFSTITALAISGINANQVTYTDKNNTDTTVDLALDNLYGNLNSKIIMNTFGTPKYNTSQGTTETTREASLTLSKGKYLVVRTNGQSWRDSNNSYTSTHDNYTSSSGITCTNNCIIKFISGYFNRPKATTAIPDTSSKDVTFSSYRLSYVEVVEDNTVITGTITNQSAHTTTNQFVTLSATQINE